MKALKKLIPVFVFLFLFPFVRESFAQTSALPQDTVIITTGINDTTLQYQKDIREVFARALKLEVKPDSLKMKGNGPFFSIVPIVGYYLQSGVTGVLTTSTSFYSSPERSKLSNILLNLYYSQYHQFWTIVNSNIFIERLKLHLSGDWRYYSFPTRTYGIGNESSFSDELNVDYSYVRFYQIMFREILDNVFAGIGYNLDYHWNINETPPSGIVYDQIHQLQDGNSSVSSGFSLNFQYDSRKNSLNPKSGSFASFQFRDNLTFLGSDKNWQSLLIDFRHFINFPANSRNVLAFWGYTNFTLTGEPPYYDLPSTGWDAYSNTGRGYVQGRYTGKNFVYAESEYRISLTRSGLFGCVVFANAESVFQKLSDSSGKINPGGGIGVRIKINKYSSSNLSIDYGFGTEGSRGFFFNLGEVF